MFGKNIPSTPANTAVTPYSTQNVESLKSRIKELETLVATFNVSENLNNKIMIQCLIKGKVA